MAERPQTYDHLRSKKKPHTATVVLALDADAAQEFEEAQKAARDAQVRAQAYPQNTQVQEDAAAAQARLDEMSENLDDIVVSFTFRSIGRKKFEKMVLDHPPTSEQVARANQYATEKEKEGDEPLLSHNPETFPVALIAACLVSPKMTEEEVQEMWDSDDWTGTELGTLFLAAQSVNIRRATLNLPKG